MPIVSELATDAMCGVTIRFGARQNASLAGNGSSGKYIDDGARQMCPPFSAVEQVGGHQMLPPSDVNQFRAAAASARAWRRRECRVFRP